AHELQRSSRTRQVAVPVRFRGRLALQVDLGGVVDRHHAGIPHDVLGEVRVVDGIPLGARVPVDEIVGATGPGGEGEHDLVRVQGLARPGDNAGLDEVDHAVDEHLGVHAEVANAGVPQHGADGVRHAADADLEARAVL